MADRNKEVLLEVWLFTPSSPFFAAHYNIKYEVKYVNAVYL